eukprot:CAMPEP_0116895044 /NCGR_PEP_ID=MMETSP0467-20121206/4657_1 /TAXON_ID=283647 /ORGANISM="Mesodinium pulex, Strain SPMC105" /LENGTH=78 /DNA_ID=CAMNT_0004565559 /DNA_START=1586 /DNA_END=1822 /DNA_ORIENTATION=-
MYEQAFIQVQGQGQEQVKDLADCVNNLPQEINYDFEGLPKNNLEDSLKNNPFINNVSVKNLNNVAIGRAKEPFASMFN